jgi:hypothetical protein
MVSEGGYAEWDAPPFLLDYYWLDGAALSAKSFPFAKTPALGVNVLVSRAGTGVLQKPYRGAKAPDAWTRYRFELELVADYRDDYLRFKTSAARGAPVWWSPGGQESDLFQSDGTSTYTLSRPLASSVVTGVNESTYPTTVLLDGAVDAAAATVSGQTVTALKSGEIEVQYTPVYRVAVVEASEAIVQQNELGYVVSLEELVQGTFA